MSFPVSECVDNPNGGLYVAGTGVSFDSVVIRFRQGATPTSITAAFPTLQLSQVDEAIAYYLENEASIDEYIAAGERDAQESAVPLSQSKPELFARLQAARRVTGSRRS